MRKKTIIILTCCLLFSLIIIAILYTVSDNITHKHNTFLRLFPSHALTDQKALDIKYDSYYIAGGASNNNYYLGNYIAPLHLLVTNNTLTDTQHVRLSIKNIKSLKLKSLQVTVDYPTFYLTDGEMPGIFKGSASNWQANRMPYDSAYFAESVPIGPSSFAIRTLSAQTHEYVLGKENTDTPHVKLT